MPHFTRENPFYVGFIKSLKGFVKVLREIEGFSDIADAISKWNAGVRLKNYYKGAEPMRCGFTVLNHGDDWINNLMFKFNENGEATEVKLLDYQMSYWVSISQKLTRVLFKNNNDFKYSGKPCRRFILLPHFICKRGN